MSKIILPELGEGIEKATVAYWHCQIGDIVCKDDDVVEFVTEGLAQGFSREELIKHKQIIPLIEKQIEHYASIYGAEKFDSAEAVVQDVIKRHQQAKGKMKILHPPTPQITLSYE